MELATDRRVYSAGLSSWLVDGCRRNVKPFQPHSLQTTVIALDRSANRHKPERSVSKARQIVQSINSGMLVGVGVSDALVASFPTFMRSLTAKESTLPRSSARTMTRWHLPKMAAVLFLGLTGCAIHPLPEDMTTVPTHTIVRKIRCEARGAIKDNLTQWLVALPDPVLHRIGQEFANGRSLTTFTDTEFPQGIALEIVQKFAKTGIAYDFTFDMTETNNLDAALDFSQLLRRALGTAGIMGNFDRTRQNIRTFTITDSFIDLMTKVKDDYCTEFAFSKDYTYPISGQIGIGEMIHTFVEMALFDNLSANKQGALQSMGDTLTFTTVLSGSIAPKIVFTKLALGFNVADASFTAGAKRTDAHKVIVGLALPPPAAPAAATAPLTQLRSGLFTTTEGTPAEQLAAKKVEEIIFRFELGRPGAVTVVSP